MKRGLKYFFSICVFLASFELSLRSLKYILEFQQSRSNQSRLENGRNSVLPEFKVLCLGESTTAASFTGSDDISWPRIFEKKMNSRASELGFTTKVFNEAVPGSNTRMIRLKLPELLDKYRPQAVVTMMGINDMTMRPGILPKEENFRLLGRILTFKVANYIFLRIKERFVHLRIPKFYVREDQKSRIAAAIKANSPVSVQKLKELDEELSGDFASGPGKGEYYAAVMLEEARKPIGSVVTLNLGIP